MDAGVDHRFGASTGYELDYNGRRYPPKAVIGLAFRYIRRTLLRAKEFSGGDGDPEGLGVDLEGDHAAAKVRARQDSVAAGIKIHIASASPVDD
jgi:hypothetical protein